MRIYLAAPWKHRMTARTEAVKLREAGFTVVSRWHEAGGPWDNQNALDVTDPAIAQQEAEMDFFDVFGSEVMIVLNIEKSEGKAVEQGIAHALNMPIYVVGTERFNVFQSKSNVTLVPTLDAAVYALKLLPQ